MRKLAALLLIAAFMAPSPALAQEPTAAPASGDTSGQATIQDTTAMSAPSVLDRASAALNAGQYEQAVVDSSLFILLNPTRAEGYYLRGVGSLNLKKTTEGLDDLSKALPLAETDPTLQAGIYGLRAQVYAGLDQLPNAVDDANSAIALAPSAELYKLRATLRMRQNDGPPAIADLEKAIQLTSDDASLYLLRGSVYASLGSDPEAATDYLMWISKQEAQQLTTRPVTPPASLPLDMAADKTYVVQINATKGQKLSMAATIVSGSVDPLIVLVAPTRQPLIANDDVRSGDPTAVIRSFVIPTDGVYALVVSHAGGGTDGQVQLQIVSQ